MTPDATFWEAESCTFLESNGIFQCIHLIFRHVYFILYKHAVSVHEDETVYSIPHHVDPAPFRLRSLATLTELK